MNKGGYDIPCSLSKTVLDNLNDEVAYNILYGFVAAYKLLMGYYSYCETRTIVRDIMSSAVKGKAKVFSDFLTVTYQHID